jgi:hypothetical protein
MKKVPASTTAALLAACSSIALADSMSREQAVEYAPLPPSDFIGKRYFSEEETPAANSLLSGMASFTSALSGNRSNSDAVLANDREWRQPKRYENGKGVYWTAYYNDVNFSQLSRPASDLSQYCKARGGTFKHVATPQRDVFDYPGQKPFEAYLSAYRYQMARLESAFAEVQVIDSTTSVITPLTDSEKERIADRAGFVAQAKAARFQADWKAYSQAAYYSDIYYLVEKSKAFGSYACVEADPSRSWKAVVLPFAVKKQRSTSNSMMRIAIGIVE